MPYARTQELRVLLLALVGVVDSFAPATTTIVPDGWPACLTARGLNVCNSDDPSLANVKAFCTRTCACEANLSPEECYKQAGPEYVSSLPDDLHAPFEQFCSANAETDEYWTDKPGVKDDGCCVGMDRAEARANFEPAVGSSPGRGRALNTGLYCSVFETSKCDHVAVLFTGDVFWALGPAVGVYKETALKNRLDSTIYRRDIRKSSPYGTADFYMHQCKLDERYYWAVTQTREGALYDKCDHKETLVVFRTGNGDKADPPFGKKVMWYRYRGHLAQLGTGDWETADNGMASIECSECAPCNAFQLEMEAEGYPAKYGAATIQGQYKLQPGEEAGYHFYKRQPATGEEDRFLHFCDVGKAWVVSNEVGATDQAADCKSFIHSKAATSRAQAMCPTGTAYERWYHAKRKKFYSAPGKMSLTCSDLRGPDCGAIRLHLDDGAWEALSWVPQQAIEFTFVGIDDGKPTSSSDSTQPLAGFPIYQSHCGDTDPDDCRSYYMRACRRNEKYVWMAHDTMETACTDGTFMTDARPGREVTDVKKLASPETHGTYFHYKKKDGKWYRMHPRYATMTCVRDDKTV